MVSYRCCVWTFYWRYGLKCCGDQEKIASMRNADGAVEEMRIQIRSWRQFLTIGNVVSSTSFVGGCFGTGQLCSKPAKLSGTRRKETRSKRAYAKSKSSCKFQILQNRVGNAGEPAPIARKHRIPANVAGSSRTLLERSSSPSSSDVGADRKTSHKLTLPQPRSPPPTPRTPRSHIRISEIEFISKSAHASTFRLCHFPFRARFGLGGVFGVDLVGPECVFGGEVGGFDGLFVVVGRGNGGG